MEQNTFRFQHTFHLKSNYTYQQNISFILDKHGFLQMSSLLEWEHRTNFYLEFYILVIIP